MYQESLNLVKRFLWCTQTLVKVKEENMVKMSKQILCSQEKVFSLNFGFRIFFVFTGDGFSLISDFTKNLCSPENPLIWKKKTNFSTYIGMKLL